MLLNCSDEDEFGDVSQTYVRHLNNIDYNENL